MAQGKTYRNCSSLITPLAIQGPEVSASWRRTSRGDVLMSLDAQGHSQLWGVSRHLEATLQSIWTPGLPPPGGSLGTNTTSPTRWLRTNSVDLSSRRPREESASIRLLADKAGPEEVIGPPDQTRTTTQEPLAWYQAPALPPLQDNRLNKVRKEEACPNPRKRAREATPFNPHNALVLISSDKEEQDKTSPPDHEKGHSAVYEYQPKSPAYPPPSDSSDEEDQ